MFEIPRLTCERCGHSWYIRIPDPVICPRCKNPLKNKKETGAQSPNQTPAIASSGGT